MATSDPFADMSLANMHIGEKPDDQTKQQQPSYDVWGITPTNAAPTPATTVPAPVPPPAASNPNKQSLPPMQAPPPPPPNQQPLVAQPMNAYMPQQAAAYPQQLPLVPPHYQAFTAAQQHQTPQVQPYPGQVAQPYPGQVAQPYPVQYAAPPPANASLTAPVPVMQQVPPQQQQVPQAPASPVKPSATTPHYDPFGISVYNQVAPTSPSSVADPFSPAPVQVAPAPEFCPTEERDDSPTPQKPTGAPECATLKVTDINEEDTNNDKDAEDIDDDEADFWAQLGFAVQETPEPAPSSSSATAPSSRPGLGKKRMSLRASIVKSVPKKQAAADNKENDAPETLDPNATDDQGLPVGGKYYDATLPGGQFGAILFNAKQLKKSIYCTTNASFVKHLGTRPVVAYTSNDSVVDNAGISVGDVILKVQGEEIKDQKSAMVHIRSECNKRCGFRGVELMLWKPPPTVDVTLAENQCMVEYHIKNASVPTTSFEWKSKYVVVGGIVSEPWVINMYYGKRDYDTAVSEIHANRPRVSVKVKSWSLLGARLLTPVPKMVHYAAKKTPWYYFVITTQKGKAIKISHPMMDGLKPVFEGVKRAIKHTGRQYGGGY